jgi:acetyl esterase/lipase
MPILPTFPLWPAGTPGALGAADQDIPTLTPFLPDPACATGAAIVVCPGGGYGGLADHEGTGYAKWLAAHGIAALVLKYRLGSHGYRHPAMLNDASRALRLSRHHAAEWSLDPHRIGIIGSSAGGHLASTLVTHYDAGNPHDSDPVEHHSSRPDLGILCYAVITMGGEHAHQGSKANLLGENPESHLLEHLSNEKQITSDTPPCFVWHTWEDPVVNVENSLDFAHSLRRAGIRFELHVYELGVHGIGLGPLDAPHRWTEDCLAWLRERGFAAR